MSLEMREMNKAIVCRFYKEGFNQSYILCPLIKV